MRKTLILSALLLFSVCQLSPAKADPTMSGVIYENTTVPFAAGNAVNSSKVGCSECTNILGIVQLGSCGINDAMKNGRIKAINHVDVSREGSFIVKKITTIVYGE